MSELDIKYLKAMEDRINKRIDELVEKTKSNIISPATQTALLGLKEEFLIQIKSINDKLDIIFPHVEKEIERNKAYSVVMSDANKLTGKAKWILYALLTWGAIYTYGQSLLKFIVGIK